MSPPVPPHVLLEHVVAAVAADLPGRFDVLLGADRFAEGRELLARLGTAAGAAAAARAPHPAEAARLTALLLARWVELAPAVVPPFAVLLAPDDGDPAYRIAVHGVDGAWTAAWTGPVCPAADGRSATPDPAADPAPVTARVFARTPAARLVLPARSAGEPPAGPQA